MLSAAKHLLSLPESKQIRSFAEFALRYAQGRSRFLAAFGMTSTLESWPSQLSVMVST
jgi:hypothetical protein